MANHRTGLLTAAAALLAFSAETASALDGEVLIDQAKAQAGGITPGDDPGFPVTISRGGKYKLTSSLIVTAGTNGINVTAPFVTIDLNSFRIFGADKANRGINAANRDGLTVMNGTIAHFKLSGIKARAYAAIEDMQITDNGLDGVELDTTSSILRSTITGSVDTGVLCISKCLIAQNVITGGKGTGVGLFTSAGGHLVLGNVIAGNGLFGIYSEGLTGFGNNTLTGNNPGGALGGTQVVGVTPVHPNTCQPACP
jgi:hypothetical protein